MELLRYQTPWPQYSPPEAERSSDPCSLQASHWQAAFGLCRHIREAGLWENEATYVLACGSCGPLWQSALAFVSTEKGTTRSLSSVLKACEMAAEWTQALRMLDSFDKYGISTTQVTINTAVSACQEHSVWPRALHLLCTCSQNEARR